MKPYSWHEDRALLLDIREEHSAMRHYRCLTRLYVVTSIAIMVFVPGAWKLMSIITWSIAMLYADISRQHTENLRTCLEVLHERMENKAQCVIHLAVPSHLPKS